MTLKEAAANAGPLIGEPHEQGVREEACATLLAHLNRLHLRGDYARFEDDARSSVLLIVVQTFPNDDFEKDAAVDAWMRVMMRRRAVDIGRSVDHVDRGTKRAGHVAIEIVENSPAPNTDSSDPSRGIVIGRSKTELRERVHELIGQRLRKHGPPLEEFLEWVDAAQPEQLERLLERFNRENQGRIELRQLVAEGAPGSGASTADRLRSFDALCAFADDTATIAEVAVTEHKSVGATYVLHTRLRADLARLVTTRPEPTRTMLFAAIKRLRRPRLGQQRIKEVQA